MPLSSPLSRSQVCRAQKYHMNRQVHFKVTKMPTRLRSAGFLQPRRLQPRHDKQVKKRLRHVSCTWTWCVLQCSSICLHSAPMHDRVSRATYADMHAPQRGWESSLIRVWLNLNIFPSFLLFFFLSSTTFHITGPRVHYKWDALKRIDHLHFPTFLPLHFNAVHSLLITV